MFLKLVRCTLIILLAPMTAGATPPARPEGAEQVFTPKGAANEFAIATKEGCCKVWVLIGDGDWVSTLNKRYGPQLTPDNAEPRRDEWLSIDFAKLDPQWQTAIRDQAKKTQGQENSFAAPPTSSDSTALTSYSEETSGEEFSLGTQTQVIEWPAEAEPTSLESLSVLSTVLGLALGLLLLLLGVLLGERRLLTRLYREARDHPSRTAIAGQIDEVVDLLKEKKSTSRATQRLQECRTALDLPASERVGLAQPLAQVTRLDPATDLLHMVQQIVEVVAKAGEQDPRSATAKQWTIFTWQERWNALLEEQRGGELAKAKDVLHRNFGDLDLVEFISKVAGVLSAVAVGGGDAAGPREVPTASLALTKLASVASLVTKELSVHSGLSAEEGLAKHLEKIRESLLGRSLKEFVEFFNEKSNELHKARELEQRLTRSIEEAERQLGTLRGQVESAQALLRGEGFGGGKLLESIQAMVRERGEVLANLRELAGEDDGSGSIVEVMACVEQQLTEVRSEAKTARSKFAPWADGWRRLASALGYRVEDHEADERPPASELQTSGPSWDLRLSFVVMLEGWPAEVANVPPEVREHLRIGEVHQGARELVGLLEDLASYERDRMWSLLKQKAVAINGIARAHEFLRTYYANSASSFRNRLAIGVSALDLAFAAAGARLVRVELLSLVGVDPIMFDVEHMDEDLRPLDGPRAKIPERLAQAREGGFPVDIVSCAFERDGEVAVRGRVEFVTPGTWIEFLPRAPSDA